MRTSLRTLLVVATASLVLLALASTTQAGMACLHNTREALCTTIPGEGMASGCKRLNDGACALIFLDAGYRSLPRSLAIIHVEGVAVTSLTRDAEPVVVRRSGEAGNHSADVERVFQTPARRGSILSAFFEKATVYTSLVGPPGEIDGILECELNPSGEVTVRLQTAGLTGSPSGPWQAPAWRLKKGDVLLIPSPEKSVVVAVSVEWIRQTDLERTPSGSMLRLEQAASVGGASLDK